MENPSIEDWAKARGPSLKRLAYLLTGNEAGADHLVQDLLVKALTKPKLLQNADDPDAYANRILLNIFLQITAGTNCTFGEDTSWADRNRPQIKQRFL